MRLRIEKWTIIFVMTSLAFAGGALGQNAEALTAHIVLKDKSTVTGARIYLSDVAKCAGSPTLCREITGIDLAASGAPGRTIFLQKSAIESILEKEWPTAVIVCEGNDGVRVDAASADVSPDDLRIKFQELVGERTAAISADIRVTVVRVQPLGFVGVRPTQSRFNLSDLNSVQFDNIDWISKNLVGTRMVQVWVENPADPQDRAMIQVQATFSVDRQMPVLKQFVAAGQVIGDTNVVLSWVAMRRGNQDFVQSNASIVGRKSRQSISAGEAVPLRYLESPLAVVRNQAVTMIVRTGGIEISARATTVDQGAVGQTVEVMNLATKKRMRARVLDEKTVEAVTF